MPHAAGAEREGNAGRGHVIRLFSRQENRSGNANTGVLVNGAKKGTDCIGSKNRITVHQQDKSRAALKRGTNPDVAATRESKVMTRFDDPNVLQRMLQKRRGPVLGMVIDNQDFTRA